MRVTVVLLPPLAIHRRVLLPLQTLRIPMIGLQG
jgi:hypothetical protein